MKGIRNSDYLGRTWLYPVYGKDAIYTLAKAIVQAHQGTLQVQSVLGKGSTFTIRLPLEVAPPNGS